MLKITESARSVNRPRTTPVRRNETRLRQLRRILTLIDVMAPCRRFYPAKEIRRKLGERLEQSVHTRTLLRDLHLLESLGMAERQEKDDRLSGAGWRLNLKCSETAQCAAIKFERAPHIADLQSSTDPAKEEIMASGKLFSVVAFENDGSKPQLVLDGVDEEGAWRFSQSRENTVVVPAEVAAGLKSGKGIAGLGKHDSQRLQSQINGALMLKRQEAAPHQFTADELEQLSQKLAHMQSLVDSGRIATPIEVGMIARSLDRFCCKAEGYEPRADLGYCSEHFGMGYGGELKDDGLQADMEAQNAAPREGKASKIKSLIDQWFGKVNEAHKLGLIDDLTEITRLAEGCRQFAQMNCEFDPFWKDLCFDGDEFLQDEFDNTWLDVSCESSSGKCDRLLGNIGAYRTE